MARDKIIRSEISFPEPVIQLVQSFLVSKQAARTSVVSKSWYKAWSTRPNLNFNRWDFRDADAFWNAVKKAVQRHQEKNLKIEGFKLFGVRVSDSESVLAELLKVLKLGIRDISIESIDWWDGGGFVLPCEMLETETLDSLSLSLSESMIDVLPNGRVICSTVKSLLLYGVILGDDLFFHNFPCLEDLTLDTCDGLKSFYCPSVKSLTLCDILAEDGFSWLSIGKRYSRRNYSDSIVSGSFPCFGEFDPLQFKWLQGNKLFKTQITNFEVGQYK